MICFSLKSCYEQQQQQQQPVSYEMDRTIVILRQHDPAPVNGVLLTPKQWMDLRQRLIDCDQLKK
jgi:hypothetical protein